MERKNTEQHQFVEENGGKKIRVPETVKELLAFAFEGYPAAEFIKILGKEYPVKIHEGYTYFIENQSKEENVVILQCQRLVDMQDGNLLTRPCYLVINDGKVAYGENREDALLALQWSDVSTNYVDVAEVLVSNRKLSLNEAVRFYKQLTGACTQGLNKFLLGMNFNGEEEFDANDILKYAKGHYGADNFANIISAISDTQTFGTSSNGTIDVPPASVYLERTSGNYLNEDITVKLHSGNLFVKAMTGMSQKNPDYNYTFNLNVSTGNDVQVRELWYLNRLNVNISSCSSFMQGIVYAKTAVYEIHTIDCFTMYNIDVDNYQMTVHTGISIECRNVCANNEGKIKINSATNFKTVFGNLPTVLFIEVNSVGAGCMIYIPKDVVVSVNIHGDNSKDVSIDVSTNPSADKTIHVTNGKGAKVYIKYA